MVFDRLKAIDSLGRGDVQSAVVMPTSSLFDSWVLLLVGHGGERHAITRARKNDIKIYKSSDAALTDARVMGLKTINVEFGLAQEAA